MCHRANDDDDGDNNNNNIVVFLHGLGHLSCSGFEALPSFLKDYSLGRVSAVWCCPFFRGG